MSATLTPFLRIDKVLEAILKANFPALADGPNALYHVGTAFPADVSSRLPFVAVNRVGGPTDRFETNPTVDIDIFHQTKDLALSLDSDISAFLLGYPRSVRIGTRLVVLDTVFQTSGPDERPWDASTTRRFASTYQFSVRR
jgi:hypothetical protein